MANVGLLSCIATKHDTFIADEYVHASMIDGMRLGLATRFKFKHNDIDDLEWKLIQAKGNKFVVIESIYSMDGDEAPLKAIIELCKQHDALLIVDEAHATGVFGNKGEGLVAHYNLQKEVYACIYTFGKALGLHGAVITGSAALRNYLINHARSFIYTTALPASSLFADTKSIFIITNCRQKNSI
ncbi:MAG: aminotransferase class I/II-fold pyridoxal phosphate-dependent enzyme [Ferruginibacter sp.]